MPRLLYVFLIATCGALASSIAHAQVKSEAQVRSQVNRDAISIVTSGIEYVSNTYITLAGEIAAVIDRRQDLRVLPIMGYGAVQNVQDVLFLRGIDVAMVHSDVLAHLKLTKSLPGAERRLALLLRLYDEPFHILARKEISDISQLAGQPVVIGPPRSGSAMSSRTVMTMQGIEPGYTHASWTEGVEMLRAGKAVAMIYPTRAPSDFLRNLQKVEALHILPMRSFAGMESAYEAIQLGHEHYPNLIPAGQSVATLQFATVLISYNWSAETQRGVGNERYAKLYKFVSALLQDLETLRTPPNHEVWRKLNLSAGALGWQRWAPAAQLISAHLAAEAKKRPAPLPAASAATGNASANQQATAGPPADLSHFRQFLKARGLDSGLSNDQLNALYQEFVTWREQGKR